MYKQKRKININETKYLIDSISKSNNLFSNLQSSIIGFVCYFNCFECFLHENEVNNWYNLSEKFSVDDSCLVEYYTFFKNRYICDGSPNSEFNDLCNNVSSGLKYKLKKQLKKDENILDTLLSISYYFRNNLYHGHKELFQLEKYTKCFEIISRILHTVIESANPITKEKKNNG